MKLKIFLYGTCTSISLYILSYLIKTFVIWEFENPLKWVIDIPNYSNDTRAGILISYVFLQACIYGMWLDYFNTQKKKLNTKYHEMDK